MASKRASASQSQDALSLQVTLSQMLDLALGTPEIGAVNLNILHNFLHVLLHQIDLRSTKVEYRGNEANRLKTMISSSKAGSSLELHEYNIIDASGNTAQRAQRSETGLNAEVYTDTEKSEKGGKSAASAPVTARGKSGKEGSEISVDGMPGAKKTRGLRHQISSGVASERQSVIFVEPVLNGVTPSALGFKRLEESVRELQLKFQALDELANNPEIIERIKSNKGDPLSDMWRGINVSKRLDASEEGIDKLTTMVQDLIKSDKIDITGGANVTEEVRQLGERIIELENQLAYLGGDVDQLKNTESRDRDTHEGASSDVRGTVSGTAHGTASRTTHGTVSGITHGTASGTSHQTASKTAHDIPLGKEDGLSKTTLGRTEESEAASLGIKNISSTIKSQNQSKTVAASASSVQRNAGKDNKLENNSDEAATIDKAENPKAPSTNTRHSVIGGIDLTELKNDMNTLKSEMKDVQRNVQDLSSKITEVTAGTNVANSRVLIHAKQDSSKSLNAAAPIAARSDDDASAANNAEELGIDATSLTSKKTVKKPSATSGFQAAEKDQTASSSHVTLEKLDEEDKIDKVEIAVDQVGPLGTSKKLESRVAQLEKEIICVMEKLNSEFEGTSGIKDIVSKIQVIQADMEKMNETASRLMEEKENRNTHTDALVEQIELLKTIKADKEDLEDALADKADAQTVNRKVSYDQFDAACDDLARGLEDAINKLGQQESIWHQALDEVHRGIEGKLDKIEISPLKEFVNNRLKLLQEKLKALAEMRRENEAAGTKKMLSDVQCISCDANVVMRMEEGAHYRAPAMPSTKSMKPYLTYELDQIRKQQKRLPHSRNMIQFEAAMQEMARKAKPLKEDLLAKSPRDHLCNRYCGGSHTTTTPQQRVMRMGHFLTQWGPEAIQLSEGVVLGNDGQLYRSRAMPVKTDVSGPSGDNGTGEIHPATPPIPEPAPISHRPSQMSHRRSSTSQVSKRLSARKPSERIKDTVEPRIEEIPVEPSTPPSAPPGTIVDEADAVPEFPGPLDEVVRERSFDGESPEKNSGEGNSVRGEEDQ